MKYQVCVTYSAGMWEQVDWSLFDVVGIDHYRNGESAKEYVGALDRYRLDKPLIVMEVGSCAHEGAAKLGAGDFNCRRRTNLDGTGIFADGIVPTRSESEQADYVEEQLSLLGGVGVDGVCIDVFSFPTYRYGEGARDLDMMSLSLVKTYPEGHLKAQKISLQSTVAMSIPTCLRSRTLLHVLRTIARMRMASPVLMRTVRH